MKMKVVLNICILALSACQTNLFFVRHAERLDNSPLSPLSAQGLAHADALRDTLQKAGIDLIYCSVYERTKQTAQPLAHALGKALVQYSPDTTLGLLPVLQNLKNKNALVVGHSDNIPRLIKALTGDSVHIAHGQYGDLYQVQVVRGVFGARRKLIRRRF